ncbi:GSCOCG00009083001-RA-CDS [Cotesia congregata]|uniref:DNA topoisomerase (ATP-hydrolyzing) n=1 Tax=Cotesia congregata TaxID=51543 RepID=A0A8J2MDF5_COTCN|nr:GSCOCG00009083001-RA-CDS [Cotesia congregata]CAG5083146.1 Similar to Spo11: Meiotic recombination protein SPO11 (Mus musculus) [Cotesia congregata]
MLKKRVEIPIVDPTPKKEQLIKKIEELTLVIIKQICNSEFPKISYQRCDPELNTPESLPASNDDNEDNEDLEDDEEELLKGSNENQDPDQICCNGSQTESTLDFSKERKRIQLVRMTIILSKVHKLLMNKKVQTNRSLYYELKSEQSTLFENEKIVNYQINSVAKLLSSPTWDLGLVAAAKGLVAGNLKLMFENEEKIDCDAVGGCLVPQIMANHMGQLVTIETEAKVIIVVEKEAVFNKLLSEGCPKKLNAILVTGKGYPDTATRIFVKMLVEKLKLPVFVLVDCNPHGFEIMSTYKYGSLNLWWERKELQCSKVKWIGVYPSEMSIYFVEKLPLTPNDTKKLDALEKRSYYDEDEKRELKLMRQGKIEIEAIAGNDFISINYLTSVYIPIKIQRFTQND